MYSLLLTISCCVCVAYSAEKVLLKDISALTFHRDVYAASNRGYRIPELSCVGGNAMKHKSYHPRSAQCYNRGFDGSDVQWECTAELDKSVRFGRTVVNCEGYRHPKDEYVLVGSCGLEYELEFVDSKRSSPIFANAPRLPPMPSLVTISPYLPFLIMILVALAIWYFCLKDVTSSVADGSHGTGSRPVGSTTMPRFPPPSYSEAMQDGPPPFGDHSTRHRPSAPPPPTDYGWDIPPSGHSSHGLGHSNYRPKVQTEPSTSWLGTGLAAGAGFLGGYLFGSADRTRTQTVTAGTTSRTDRLYPDLDGTATTDEFYHHHGPTTSTASHEDRNGRYVAKSFAKTKRR